MFKIYPYKSISEPDVDIVTGFVRALVIELWSTLECGNEDVRVVRPKPTPMDPIDRSCLKVLCVFMCECVMGNRNVPALPLTGDHFLLLHVSWLPLSLVSCMSKSHKKENYKICTSIMLFVE